jgi:hypothetical protein
MAALAWADHGGGDLRQPADPLLAALLWGAAAFLVAIVVALLVFAFTRRPSGSEE